MTGPARACAAAALFVTLQYPAAGAQAPGGRSIAILNVGVISMSGPTGVRTATVVVRNGRIVSVGPTPAKAVGLRIDGSGKYLIPGLTDAHVHLPTSPALSRAVCDLLLANGVTTAVDLAGSPAHLELRSRIARGEMRGPTVLVSGGPLGDPHGRETVTSPDAMERAVAAQKRSGYDVIKFRGDATRKSYHAVISAARRNAIALVGHAPRNLGVAAMLEERQPAVAHMEEYLYAHFHFRRNPQEPIADAAEKIRFLTAGTARAGTSVITTLAVYRGIADQAENLERVLSRREVSYVPRGLGELWGWWPPRNIYRARFGRDTIPWFRTQYRILEQVTSAFHKAGVPLLAGTDTPTSAVAPGFSLHDELQALVAAGLSPYDALRTATVHPAVFLKTHADNGTIEPGKRADMILLRRNPLEDISRTKEIEGVFVRGEWFPKEKLLGMLEAQREGSAR